MNNQSSISTIKNLPAEESHLNLSLNTLLAQDLMNTLMLKICLKVGTGEMLMESTIFPGIKINIFLNTVVAAGLKEPPALSLIESILPETELGLTLLFHPKLSSTARLEEVATEVMLEESIAMLRITVSLKKVVKTILQKILSISLAHQYKDVLIVVIQRDKNQEILATVGQLLVIQSGKSLNMEP